MSQLTALLLTLALELAIVMPLILTQRTTRIPSALPWWHWGLLCVAASLLTHPIAWWANGVLSWPWWPRFFMIEALVVVVEMVVYQKFSDLKSWRLALLLSTCANVFSAGVGLWIWQMGWSS